ncbi:mucosa-associated lymphoid tissue lymphoma translocation protein 1 isoform X4 [Anolis sagrei]|uniref:mucosa-associated lymphoid tissue lymphoma translocation protein 1 isoform X4 n=1 Tax=Anolis sagrei TaxID=38937 RepID=UPI0035211736
MQTLAFRCCAGRPQRMAGSGPGLAPASSSSSFSSCSNSLPLQRLPEPLLALLSDSLDRAPPGKGWRELAQVASSQGGPRLRLSSPELEQCSLQVLEPEGSPSRSLLQLMGERGCTVQELMELLQALKHTEALQYLNPPSIKIVLEPESLTAVSGQMVKLSCWAAGYPLLHYQWFKGDKMVPHGNSPELMFNQVSVDDAGFYICRVNSDFSYGFSQWARLDVSEGQGACHEDLSCLGKPDLTEKQSTERQSAVDKVALLMGNMSYRNHPKLKAPLVDVYELTNLLRQLDFKVVSVLDLTEPEMRNAVNEFLLLLDKGVYGLLYYAGHGYENYGNSFMVPIDAPNPYRAANCLCVQNILRRMQEKQTGLNVFLLDMCRKRNEYDNTILILDALKVTANIVFGYATCQGAEAFEIQQSGLSNGIFVKFLKERLLEDKKITVLLDGVAEDMGKCHLTKGKQALEIRSSLSEKRALTDPIQQTVTSAEALARNLQWAKAHELPESMCLQFNCGVQIQLGFAAEFSNVIIVYTRIIKKPPEITVCNAYVTDFPLDLDVDPKEANKGTPEETGSYLLSKDLPKHCLYTRICSLQKLKEDLTFTVYLHYEYDGVDEVVDERKVVNIGKPLIAKLRIHQGIGKNSCFQHCCAPNRPCFTQSSDAQPAVYHPSRPNHHPHSYAGFSQPNSAHPEDILHPAMCHSDMTPNRLMAWQTTWPYSFSSNQGNMPVETTDELESDFSENFRLS